jgi:hypothetical protein
MGYVESNGGRNKLHIGGLMDRSFIPKVYLVGHFERELASKRVRMGEGGDVDVPSPSLTIVVVL